MITVRLPHGEWQFDPKQPLGAAGRFGQVFAGTGIEGVAVAVKQLKLTASQAAHRELQIADRLMTRALSHVIPTLDAGQDAESDRYYVVMPRAERSPQDQLTASGALVVVDAIKVLLEISDGLIEAADIVRRDPKPANVLWHDGRWKIADFGIAGFVEDSTSANTVRESEVEHLDGAVAAKLDVGGLQIPMDDPLARARPRAHRRSGVRSAELHPEEWDQTGAFSGG
jgi:eukaryotic-like serine/threonine-protein kinase